MSLTKHCSCHNLDDYVRSFPLVVSHILAEILAESAVIYQCQGNSASNFSQQSLVICKFDTRYTCFCIPAYRLTNEIASFCCPSQCPFRYFRYPERRGDEGNLFQQYQLTGVEAFVQAFDSDGFHRTDLHRLIQSHYTFLIRASIH